MNEEPHFHVPDAFGRDAFLGHFNNLDIFFDSSDADRGDYIWCRSGDGAQDFTGVSADTLRRESHADLVFNYRWLTPELTTFLKSYVTLLQ